MQALILSDDAFRQEGCASIIFSIYGECDIQKFNKPQQIWSSLFETDLILVDVKVSSGNVWEDTLITINEKRPNAPVCLISSLGSNDCVKAAFDIGAKGYLHSGASRVEVEETIRGVVLGKIILPSIIWKPCSKDTHPLLTAKQIEIMNQVKQGYSNQKIADSLDISIATVKRHVSNILNALSAKNRIEAINIFQNHHNV